MKAPTLSASPVVTSDAAGSVRGWLGLFAVLVAGVLAVSYPLLALGFVVGALTVPLVRHGRRAVAAYHRRSLEQLAGRGTDLSGVVR